MGFRPAGVRATVFLLQRTRLRPPSPNVPTHAAMLLAAALALCAPQTTWYVDAAAPGPGSGTAADPFNRIEYALEQPAVQTGDTVLVAPGEYVDETVDFGSKNVTVASTGGAAVTTIRGRSGLLSFAPTVRFVTGENETAVLDGFTIVGGGGEFTTVGTLPLQVLVGCGLVCRGSSPTLRNLVFEAGPDYAEFGTGAFFDLSSATLEDCVFDGLGDDAAATRGGGIAAFDSSLLLRDTRFTACVTGWRGGGVYAEDSTLQAVGCTFEDSFCFYASGPGIAARDSNVTLQDCDFTSNTGGDAGGAVFTEGGTFQAYDCRFVGNDSGFDAYPGGGLWTDAPGARVVDCLFEDNNGRVGGGAWVSGVGSVVERCVFRGNTAYGAGQYTCFGGGLFGGELVRECLFVGNTAIDTFSDGGGALVGAVAVDRCTFVSNSASPGTPGSVHSIATLRNSIVRDPSAEPIGFVAADVQYSNVQGGHAGEGNIDVDPRFWDVREDLALLPGSPCIDAGDPASASDPDGTRADMGAYPFDPFHCGAFCNGPLGSTTCIANVNSTGAGADIVALGSDVVAEDRFVLTASGVPSAQFGFFLASETPSFQPLGGNSQGVVCLGGWVLRLDDVILQDRGTGAVSLRPNLANLAQGQPVLAGDTWHFQYWFRDQNPAQTSNTSATVRVTFQ